MSKSYYYNLKLIECGNRIEIYRYSIAQEYGFEGKNKAGRKGIKNGMANKEKNRREVLNRARNQIIRLVNCNPDLTTFVTLTYAINMQDLKLSKIHLNKFIKDMQRDFPEFKYLYVLEYQERGAIHYHMLNNLPVNFNTAKPHTRKTEEQKDLENYFREVYWPRGFVDIRNLTSEGNANVGLYVSVYLVEDLFKLDLKGSKCYGFSRNLCRPKETKLMSNEDGIEVVKRYSNDHKVTYASSYNMRIEDDLGVRNGIVNYYDMYKGDI